MPNVLVAGFPKCGSTFLYHLLKQHPDIFIPKIKELNYFNKDNFFLSDPEILNPRYFKPFSWYLSFFRTNKKVVIDFSILSALDFGSAKRVKNRLGDIKIIFIVRDKRDYIRSVEKFVLKERGDPNVAKKYSNFADYMGNYKRFFSSVLLVKLESINKNPEKELNRITKFLELKKWKFNTRVPKHETKEYKMSKAQLIKRSAYFYVIKTFYALLSLSVRAKLKAQGEK